MLLKSLPEVLCPNCTRSGGLAIFQRLESKPMGSFSLAGMAMKVSVLEVLVLDCDICDWFVLGHRDGEDAVFPDPHASGVRG